MFYGDKSVPAFKSQTKNIDGFPLSLLLVYFCSLFSVILRIQPRSEDRCAELLLNRLRDLQATIATSYLDDPTNLAGAETQHAGSLSIPTHPATSLYLPRLGKFFWEVGDRERIPKGESDLKIERIKMGAREICFYEIHRTRCSRLIVGSELM